MVYRDICHIQIVLVWIMGIFHTMQSEVRCYLTYFVFFIYIIHMMYLLHKRIYFHIDYWSCEEVSDGKRLKYALVGKLRLTRYCHNYACTSNQILKAYSISLCNSDPGQVSKNIWSFHGPANPSTVADPTCRPSLMLPLTAYRNSFTRAETDTFYGRYSVALKLYHIETSNAASSIIPQEVVWQIYDVEN